MIKLLASGYFGAAFLLAWMAVFRYPKSEQVRNGVADVVLSYLTLIGFGLIPAGIFSLLHIPVQLFTLGTVYLLSAAALIFAMHKSRARQRYRWEPYDIAVVLLLLGVTAAVTIRFFTPELRLRYWSSDAAVHLKYALNTYRNSEVSQMYFAPLYSSVVIGLLAPFLDGAELYKGFLLSDASLFYLGVVMFFLLIREHLKTKWKKAAGLLVCLLYLFGYPLYSYIHTFFYWGIGVLYIGYLLYVLRLYLGDAIKTELSVFLLFVGCTGVILSYALFAPPVYAAVFYCLVKKQREKGKLLTGGNVLLALRIFLLPCLLGLYYCYVQLLVKTAGSLSAAIATEGAIHQEWYMDFILLLPLILFWVLRKRKEHKTDESVVFFVAFAVYLVVMFAAVFRGLASGYYYYKLYYPLWLLGWLLAVSAFLWLWGQLRELAVSIVLITGGLLLLCFGGVEDKLTKRVGVIVPESKSGVFFPLYRSNQEYLKRDWAEFELYDQLLELVEYTGQEGADCVPFLCGDDQYAYCYWYEALSGYDCLSYYGWFHPIGEEEQMWKKNGIKRIAVWKPSAYYLDNAAYFEQYEKLFENQQAVVYQVAAEQ